jgi:hypothetical protein
VFRRSFLLILLLGLVGLGGCVRNPESGPKLTGRLLADGQPCRPASLYEFEVKFLSAGGEGPIKKSYLATVQEDGTFTVNGSIGKGIPVGRYKVIITGPVLDAAGRPTRRYIATYTDKATPLEIEITDATQEVTIDLGRKTAAAS